MLYYIQYQKLILWIHLQHPAGITAARNEDEIVASKLGTSVYMNGARLRREDSRCIERLAGEQSVGTLEQRANERFSVWVGGGCLPIRWLAGTVGRLGSKAAALSVRLATAC